ncbi:MAG: hypothetical protein K0S37_2295 [Microbacterium sp.]|jgi:hypothetical protein|nr:hypothetical protein [Microbacterium sp.]
MSVDLTSVPVAPADPTELRRCAQAVRQAGAPLRLNAEEILFAWGLLPAVYRAPEASDLQGAMVLTGPAAVEVITGLGLACDAVENLADELDAVNRERDALVLRLEGQSLPGLPELPVSDDPFARRLDDEARADAEAEFRRQCTALVDRWEAAVDACAAALRAIPEVPWSLSSSLRVDEQTLGSESTSITDAAALPLLDRLAMYGGVDAARLLAAHPEWVAVIRRAHPATVASWWKSLPAATAATLMTTMPTVIGNLDGVAIATRVAVNCMRAAAWLDELRRQRREAQLNADPLTARFRSPSAQADSRLRAIDAEIAYFLAVQDGRKQLYAWDPDHGSLIEMSGDPSRATSALFVIPGTNTQAASFFGDKPITRFADWQTRAGQGSVLSFTVMTGPMPQLSEIALGGGPQFNTYAPQRAPEYANFVQGVEAAAPGLWTMSYEHSYAGAIGSAAEAYGGIVDARFMSATVGAIGPYTPAPDTRYFAAQAPDDINRYYAGLRLADVGFDVPPESFPGVQIADTGLPGLNPANLLIGDSVGIVADSIDHHNALMSDDESVNGPVLRSVKSLLGEGPQE